MRGGIGDEFRRSSAPNESPVKCTEIRGNSRQYYKGDCAGLTRQKNNSEASHLLRL
jgi:hypothetical protein